MQLKVIGASSKKEITITISKSQLESSLMDTLKDHNFPVASSCRGEGICRLCIVNEKTLSCQISTKEFLEKDSNIVRFSYL